MADTRALYLLRHGQTAWNAEQRLQGGSDSPLTARGKKQAQAIAESLKQYPPVFLYSSPLGRARETAEIIAKDHDMPMVTDGHLSELRCGEAEGLTLEEAYARWPELQAARDRDKWRTPWPGGESYRDVDGRLARFVADTLGPRLGERAAGPLGVVGHQSMNMVLLGRLLGLEPSLVISIGQPNHVIYRLRGKVVDHAYLGENHLEWQPGVLRKRSDEVVALSLA